MKGSRALPRWWSYWAVAWVVVAIVWTTDVAFQFIRAGAGIADLYPALVDSFLTIIPGALLSLLALVMLSKGDLASRWLPIKISAYVVFGALYWLVWSLAAAAMQSAGIFAGQSGAEGFAIASFHQLAGSGFNASLLFAGLVTAYEARHHARTAKHAELRAAQLRAELARAQMTALNTQLSPHFLFNTIHVASGLMVRDVAAARAVLADLAALLRGSLEIGERDLIPLRDEVRLTERYLDIQKIRFRDRLSVELDLDPRTLELGVPPLLLQPLVENAIVHGVSRSRKGGWVRIQSVCQHGGLHLLVADSGPAKAGEVPGPRIERIGLGGTRRRLELHYGDHAFIGMMREEGAGFRVQVVLPAIIAGKTRSSPALVATELPVDTEDSTVREGSSPDPRPHGSRAT